MCTRSPSLSPSFQPTSRRRRASTACRTIFPSSSDTSIASLGTGNVRACYEASGAGYVLHRAMQEWGYDCDVIAPSLIPKRPGVQRKHDKYDAAKLAPLYRAGELTAVRIPTEAEERVRDVVRCRETFQREILKSRHYILKFLARRGFVFREGTNWCTPHLRWLQHLTTEQSPLAPADRLVFREYHALLMYKLQRRDDLDREIERLAELPTLAPAVRRLQCFRGISLHSAMVLATEIVDWRRFERPSQLACYLGLVSREDSSGDLEKEPMVWESEVKALKTPVLIIAGDVDVATLEHMVKMFRLVGGGAMGDMVDMSKLPASRLAIMPATAHTAVITQPDLLHAFIEPFLKGVTPKGMFEP